jgi:hypothetical protein
MNACLLVADDFGMSREINAAIVAAQDFGSIHGASLMVDQEFTAEAVGLAKSRPGMNVGLHLNFTDLRLSDPAWPGFPWCTNPLAAHGEARLPWHAGSFRRETRRQFEAYLSTGLPLAFVNGHHHMHVEAIVFAEVQRCLAEMFPDFRGWMRLGRSGFFGLPGWLNRTASSAMPTPTWKGSRTSHLHLAWTVGQTRIADVLAVLDAPGGIDEVILHPGIDKSAAVRKTRGDDGHDRRPDAALLLDDRVRQAAQRQLAALQAGRFPV